MEGATARYRAFISYSHRDALFAARLHRRLESYALPRQLGVGRRLTPIFKDREELPAASDLSAQVRSALAAADCLIVVCSPDAAASPWVGREIETFHDLHPDRPILAALARGEPAEAFPPALTAGGGEPLAADFRKTGDGARLALLKLVAGLAGVGLDRLIQRDAQRRLRGVMAITAAALAGMLTMTLTTAFALNARAEAERQRAEAERQRAAAEDLVESMLTSIRTGLKGAGQLSVRTAVNRDALAFYAKQDLTALPPASLRRNARVMLDMGEDELDRDQFDTAASWFDQAYRMTAQVLKADPMNPDAIWAHAHSAYWKGYLAFLNNDAPAAKAAWLDYRRLAGQLEAAEPGASRGLYEVASADLNLCTLSVRKEKTSAAGLIFCGQAVSEMERAYAAAPSDPDIAYDMSNSLAWQANAFSLAGQRDDMRAVRTKQIELLDRLLKADPDNARLLDSWGMAQLALARDSFDDGDYARARQRLAIFKATFSRLAARDPENARWREQVRNAEKFLTSINVTEARIH